MRTRAVALSEGNTKVVSERLNWRASACWAASSRPVPSSNTQRGLPVRRPPRAKTLRMRKAYAAMARYSSRGGGRGRGAGEPLEELGMDAAEAAVGHHQHVVARGDDEAEGFHHGA